MTAGDAPLFATLRSETYRATGVDVADLLPCEHEAASLDLEGDRWSCDRCGETAAICRGRCTPTTVPGRCSRGAPGPGR
jgi:hypothetical protein